MRIVKLTRDMRPNGRAGDDIVVPDEVAAKLVKEQLAKDPRPYPPPDVAPAVPVGEQPKLKRAPPYFTRKRGAA